MQRLQLAEGAPEGLGVWRLSLGLNAPEPSGSVPSGFTVTPTSYAPWRLARPCGDCYQRTPV